MLIQSLSKGSNGREDMNAHTRSHTAKIGGGARVTRHCSCQNTDMVGRQHQTSGSWKRRSRQRKAVRAIVVCVSAMDGAVHEWLHAVRVPSGSMCLERIDVELRRWCGTLRTGPQKLNLFLPLRHWVLMRTSRSFVVLLQKKNPSRPSIRPGHGRRHWFASRVMCPLVELSPPPPIPRQLRLYAGPGRVDSGELVY